VNPSLAIAQPASFPLPWLTQLKKVNPTEPWVPPTRGGWIVLEHFRSPDVQTLVAQWAPANRGSEILLDDEARAAGLRARGGSIKSIAFEQGWSPAATTKRVKNAGRKVKLRSDAELVAFFGDAPSPEVMASGGPAAWPSWAPRGSSTLSVRDGGESYLVIVYPAFQWRLPDCLSRAESRVVRELLEDRSQSFIAGALGISQCTVAVQIASVYRKLKVHGRIELFVALREASCRG
jgi:DNA-binding NarL/FixJ family response regulator